MPLFTPRFWHHHFGKVAAFWALATAIPMVAAYGGPAGFQIYHVLVADYVPFIILLFSLYTISGGIRLEGDLAAHPLTNTAFMAIGAVLASFIGTTGAAMLLIRPLIRANDNRRHNVHVIVFFIFLVANVGGALTPLGDPPLFLGFLNGVRFFWTMEAMFAYRARASQGDARTPRPLANTRFS